VELVSAPRLVSIAFAAVVLAAACGGTDESRAHQPNDGADVQVPGDGAPPPRELVIAPPDVLAERLARFLWAAASDPVLRTRLQAEPLTLERVSQIADSMMADPRALAGARAFYRWWLLLDTLESVEKVDPEGVLDPELRRSMVEEAPALGAYLTLETGGTLRDLLTVPFTFVNERLARHYGIEGVSGRELRRVPYPEGQNRSGVMTGVGLLTLFASLASPSWPAKRSWMVTDPFLCILPIRTLLPTEAPDPTRSIRQQMLDITKDVGCMGCHRILNSPGFAFIGFDSFGRWRPEAGHGAGETAGWIPADIMRDEPRFEGPAQLADLLASREETARCVASRWLEYSVAPDQRPAESRPDSFEPSLAAVVQTFRGSGFELKALVRAIVRSELFVSASP
jgi:hypothetical protein